MPMSTLEFDPSNVRVHSPANIAAIAASLEAFGQRRPLVIRGNVVIAGNGTLEAARSLGWVEILVTDVPEDWSDDQARAYALADNRTAELASWNDSILLDQLAHFDSVGFDVSQFGFESTGKPDESVWENLGDAVKDRQPFQQISFTLSDDQVAVVRNAMDRAKTLGPFVDSDNANMNGNALARIAETFNGLTL